MAEDNVSREAEAQKAAEAQALATQTSETEAAAKAEAAHAEANLKQIDLAKRWPGVKKWMTRQDDPTLGPEWDVADPTQIDQGHTEE